MKEESKPEIIKETRTQTFSSSRLLLIATVGLAILGIIVFVTFLLINKNSVSSAGDLDDNSSSFPYFIPIWTAIFVPLIAAQQRKKEETISPQAKIVLLVGTLLMMLLIGVTFFILK